jgi:hypothetical protein
MGKTRFAATPKSKKQAAFYSSRVKKSSVKTKAFKKENNESKINQFSRKDAIQITQESKFLNTSY